MSKNTPQKPGKLQKGGSSAGPSPEMTSVTRSAGGSSSQGAASPIAEMELDVQDIYYLTQSASFMADQGQWDLVIEQLQPALPVIRRSIATHGYGYLQEIAPLVEAFSRLGQWEEVKELLLPTLPVMRDEYTLRSIATLAEALWVLHSAGGSFYPTDELALDGTTKLLQPALWIMRIRLGQGNHHTLRSTAILAQVEAAKGQWKEVAELLQPALPIMRVELGEGDHYTLKSIYVLAEAKAAEGQWEEVAELLQPVLPAMEKMDEYTLRSTSLLVKALGMKPARPRRHAYRRKRDQHKPNMEPIPDEDIVPYLSSLFSHRHEALGLRISLQGFLSLPSSPGKISEPSIEFRGFNVNSMANPTTMTYTVQDQEVLFYSNENNRKYTEAELLELFQTTLLVLLKSAYVRVGNDATMTSCQRLAQEFDCRARRTIWSLIADIEGVENIEVGQLGRTRDDYFAVVYRSPRVQTPLSILQNRILPWIDIRDSQLQDSAFKYDALPTISTPTLQHTSPGTSPQSTSHRFFQINGKPYSDSSFEASLGSPDLSESFGSPKQYLVAGCKLKPQLDDLDPCDPVTAPFGTFGCFIKKLEFENDIGNIGDCGLGGLTIGHVVLDHTTEAYIEAEDETTTHTVKVHQSFCRSNGKPEFMRGSSGPQLSPQLHEIMFLEVPPHQKIKPEIENLDCRALAYSLGRHIEPWDSGEDDHAYQFSPMTVDRGTLWDAVTSKEEPMIVYKNGAGSGLTEGHLVGLCYARPGTYQDQTRARIGRVDPEGPFWGIVKWLEGTEGFSRGGDSGAIVYAKSKDNLVTPIGIHSGSMDDRSYFLILSVAVDEIERVTDYTLEFVDGDDMESLGEGVGGMRMT